MTVFRQYSIQSWILTLCNNYKITTDHAMIEVLLLARKCLYDVMILKFDICMSKTMEINYENKKGNRSNRSDIFRLLLHILTQKYNV